jgi:hypothetical protein
MKLLDDIGYYKAYILPIIIPAINRIKDSIQIYLLNRTFNLYKYLAFYGAKDTSHRWQFFPGTHRNRKI